MQAQRRFFYRMVIIASAIAFSLGLAFSIDLPSVYAAGTTYYINNQSGSHCSDSGPGTSPSQPWCDFTNANTTTFQPGDQILLARGATWNQALYLHGSGTSWNPGAFISVDAYGSGADPHISGNGNAADRTIVLPSNPNYWSISDLELSNAGMGIIANYTTLDNQGLRFNNLYIHDISGITHASPTPSDFPGIYNSSAIAIGVLGSATPPVPTGSQWVVKDIQITNVESANANGFYFWIVPPGNPNYPYTSFPVTSIQQVTIKNCYVHNSPLPSLAMEPVSNITILDNRFDFAGHRAESQGTTGAFFYDASNVTLVNNTLENMNNTGSSDQTASDNEGYVNQMIYRGNYFANNAGAGTEFLALSGRTGDYSTNHEVSDNAFANNATAGSSTYRSSLLFINQSGETMTGTAANNLSYEPTGFVTGASGTSWTFTNNLSVPSASDLFNGGNDFSSTQGQGQWSYQYYDGSSYTNLTYDAVNQWWGSASYNIARFDEYPSTCNSCWIARTWTAPSAGTISIRGRVLKNDITGGDGVAVRITRNGTQIWPGSGGPQAIAYNDQSGVATDLDGVNVAAGDVFRFEVNNGGSGNNANDSTSWSPSIGYTAVSSTSGTSFVTAVSAQGSIRNNSTANIGMKITVGSNPIVVQSLGRYFLTGNSGTHTLEIVRVSDGTVLGSVSINMGTGTADALGYKYVTLSSPVTLAANTAYYIVSSETNGGDSWYDNLNTTLTVTSVATINGSVYSSGSSWVENGGSGNCYVPLNFTYSTSFATAVSTGSQLRNDFGNFVGMQITTGSTGLTIQSLGRYYVSGNSQTHTLEIVRASDGAVLGSATVNMGAGQPDALGFKYALLGTPVTLAANTTYYIVSSEVSGGDQWYGTTSLPSLTTTGVAMVNSGIYFSNNAWHSYGSSGNCYVPLNFTY